MIIIPRWLLAVILTALTVATLTLLIFIASVQFRPAPIPRIIDEHGNNLVYQCPGDARCKPTPSTP